MRFANSGFQVIGSSEGLLIHNFVITDFGIELLDRKNEILVGWIRKSFFYFAKYEIDTKLKYISRNFAKFRN